MFLFFFIIKEGIKIECQKCRRVNPPQAKFCFNCGNELSKIMIDRSSSSGSFKYCQNCGYDNPPDARFCYQCGSEIKQQIPTIPKSSICPTCGITVSSTNLFCPNCSQSLIAYPPSNKIVDAKEFKSLNGNKECPACGLMTKGDYCHNCGYHLMETKRKSSHSWWYCQRDSAIMAEVDQNLQILISRNSVDESLIQAVKNNLLQSHDRENAKNLVLQILDEGITEKFTVITKVQCPVCGSYSYAPVTKRPRQVIGYGVSRPLTLNAGNILRTGLFYLRTYPLLLVIITIALILDAVTFTIGFSSSAILSIESLFLDIDGSNPITIDTSDPLTFLIMLIVSTLLSLIITCFVQTWYLTSLKEIKDNNSTSFNLVESFKSSISYFPRIFGAQMIITGSLTALSFLIIIMAGAMLSEDFYELNYDSILFYMFILLGLLLGVTGLSFVLSILFAYVQGSIVFGESGVFKSFSNSYRFARKHLGTTFGVLIVFNFITYIISVPIGMFLGSFLLIFPTNSLSLIFMSTLMSALVTRVIEAYKTISMGWAYDEFKSMIE